MWPPGSGRPCAGQPGCTLDGWTGNSPGDQALSGLQVVGGCVQYSQAVHLTAGPETVADTQQLLAWTNGNTISQANNDNIKSFANRTLHDIKRSGS